MQRLNFTITGIGPLLQHSEALANPMNPVAKEMAAISKKRGKSDTDFEDLAKIEFKGGMYHDPEIGPYVQAIAVERCLFDSAKREKLGTTFKSYVQCSDDRLPIQYDGPRDIEGLWSAGFFDQRMVKIQMSKTLRTRPKFPIGWKLDIPIMFDEVAVDRAQIVRCMERAGEAIGLGDFRPRFGRFTVKVVK